jgi:hypothetical protein
MSISRWGDYADIAEVAGISALIGTAKKLLPKGNMFSPS